MLRILISPLVSLVSTALFGAQPSTVTLKTSAAIVKYGRALTLTAIVTPPAATGEVAFYSGVTILETKPLIGGKATFTTTLLPYGAQTLTASYGGDATYTPSTSPPVAETVKTLQSRGFGSPIASGPTYCYGPIVIGDFNGDGKPDVASASGCPGGVNVLLGNGDGTFQEPSSYVVGPGNGQDGFDVAVGDFNGDGKADLAVTYQAGLSVLLGNGDGTFQPAVNSFVPFEDFEYLAVGDFNGDGKADVAIGNESGLAVLLGNGDATFQPSVIYPPYQVGDVVVADFNADGKADLAVLCYGAYLDVYLGNGDGTFQPPSGIAVGSAVSLAPGDFNGDGKEDLAIDTGNGPEIVLGNGDGTFQPPIAIDNPYGANNNTIEVGDINGDGIADVVLIANIGNSSFVDVLLGNGNGTFQSGKNSPSEPAYNNPIWTALADLNGDGKVDLVESILYIPISAQLGSLVGPTATTLTSSPNPSVFGESVLLRATVSPALSTGTVTFYNGSTELGTSNVRDGIATFVVSTLPVGIDAPTAAYSGSTYEFPSTSFGLSQQVTRAPSSTTLLVSPNPASLGQTVTLLAEVAPGTATGRVTFYDGPTMLKTVAVVNGQAQMTTSTLSEGSHLLSATYFGSVDYIASTSFTVTETVN